jgi:16S rRNA (uracil1498-N3)-methyltransferase
MAELRGDEARHLTRVLRVEAGQKFEISDSQSAWLAEVVEARGQHVVFRVLEPILSAEAPVSVILYAALTKFDRFEWLVEKATECGVETIVPVEAARTEKGLFGASRKRSERWERVAREASQQARRTRLPGIAEALHLDGALRAESGLRFFLDEAESQPLLRLLPDQREAGTRVALLVGPEGGWTEAERASAIAAGWRGASLGTTILRAETAGTVGVALLVNAWIR